MLNWIYVSLPSRELRYGNRTASIEHTVGPWAWDSGEDGAEIDDSHAGGNGGGLTLAGKEGCVAVESEAGWQLFWEDADGNVPVIDGKKRRKLQVSIERIFVEDVENAGMGVKADEDGKANDKGKEKEERVGKMQGGVEVHGDKGQKREDRRTEATLEVRTKTIEEGKESDKRKEERTRYEYRG